MASSTSDKKTTQSRIGRKINLPDKYKEFMTGYKS